MISSMEGFVSKSVICEKILEIPTQEPPSSHPAYKSDAAFDCAQRLMQEKIREAVKNEPAADVKTVKHGHWIHLEGKGGRSKYLCSVCKCKLKYDQIGLYCKNCGADMKK